MKKYILSSLIIGTFSLYFIYLRVGGSSALAALPAIPPTTLINTQTTTEPSQTPPSTQAPNPTPNPTPAPAPVPVQTGQYKDGTYTGVSANAYYGYVQVATVISGGKLTEINILDYPQDRGTSVYINSRALPYLEREAISAQSANINTVSGASDSSGAFKKSLASALSQAKNS